MNKIEKLIKVSLNAGAFGAKINGSGGGGCMIAYAPKNPEKIFTRSTITKKNNF